MASEEFISFFKRYRPGSMEEASGVLEKTVMKGPADLITPSSTRVLAMSVPVSPWATSMTTSPVPGPG